MCLSYRVATRLNCLRYPKKRSMIFLSWYICASMVLGFRAVLRDGMTGLAPHLATASITRRPSYPLSANTWLALKPSNNASACVISLRWPAVAIKRNGKPVPSVRPCIFVVRPPFERPSAWASAPLFYAVPRQLEHVL